MNKYSLRIWKSVGIETLTKALIVVTTRQSARATPEPPSIQKKFFGVEHTAGGNQSVNYKIDGFSMAAGDTSEAPNHVLQTARVYPAARTIYAALSKSTATMTRQSNPVKRASPLACV